MSFPFIWLAFCRERADPTVAVPPRVAVGQFQRQLYHMGRDQWGIQDDGP